MNVTEPIIRTALLGTGGKDIPASPAPPALAQSIERAGREATEPEEGFYRRAALTFAWQRAGQMPGPAAGAVAPSEAPADDLPCFSREAGDLLVRLCDLRSPHLLPYAYRRATRCQRLIPPVCLRPLIARSLDPNIATRLEEQNLLNLLMGQRGHWLLQQMQLSDWGKPEEEDWETAPYAERKRMLSLRRRQDPAQGRALLQSTWKSESAPHREELLKYLHTGLSLDDEPFLTQVRDTDRSSAVRDRARQLLDQLPQSAQVQTYCQWLSGKLHYRLLTGWSYDPLPFTPEMKKLGLEETSPAKGVKDHEYLLCQLAERVPLSFWAEFYQHSPEEAARKLAERPPFKGHFHVSQPIRTFADRNWAYHTLRACPQLASDTPLMFLLTPDEREDIDLGRAGNLVTGWLPTDGRPWGPRFSDWVWRSLQQSRYPYSHKALPETLALSLHPSLRPRLEQVATQADATNNLPELCRDTLAGMDLKAQIDALFPPPSDGG